LNPHLLCLNAYGYNVVVDLMHGASLAALRWRQPEGSWFELLALCPPADIARTGGCFVMAPFANRLDDGRFGGKDGQIIAPLNRPDLDLAIHGFSRDRRWRAESVTDTSLTLVDDYSEPATPLAYRLVQDIAIHPHGVDLKLALTNVAGRRLPYGFGFHPWFRREEATWLTVETSGMLDHDTRGFPSDVVDGLDFGTGLDVSRMPWFDGHLIGWKPRFALVEWRRAKVSLRLTATGALTNLHVYVPDDRPVLCIEPVSHVPDVHNRRHLARYGDVAWLASGETMCGGMTLSVSAIAT